jgi:DNA-directed RNA polymerase specialized sigma24 family protein/ribosome-associated translation inhibitor RaiA
MHWVFNQCDDEVKRAMRAYWEKKWPRLEKLLAKFPLDVRDIRLRVTCHRPGGVRPWYDLHAVLRLPIGTLAADTSGKEPHALVDHVADLLAEEIKRRKERGSKSYVYKRKNRSHADLTAPGPRPQRGLEHRQEFFAMWRPLLPRLGQHARHELRALEAKGLLHRGELTVADLLDEVFTDAWQKYEDRPRGVLLETWFNTLMHEAIEHWIQQEPHPYRSVDQQVREELPSDARPQVDDQEWWAWLLGYRDRWTVADLLPARESFDAAAEGETPADAVAENVEDAAGSDAGAETTGPKEGAPGSMAGARRTVDPLDTLDEPDKVWLYLRDLPTIERQALIFHVLDGLSPDEIAMLQDRPESEVRGDIEAARATLRERLLAGTESAASAQQAKPTRSAARASAAAESVAATKGG